MFSDHTGLVSVPPILVYRPYVIMYLLFLFCLYDFVILFLLLVRCDFRVSS